MFINEIVITDLGFAASNSKKIVNNHDIIHYYGQQEPIKNHTYKVKQDYPYEDEYGRYRISSSGGRQSERGRVGIIKNPHLWTKNGNSYARKLYDYNDNTNRPYKTNWSFNSIQSSYPTEKPEKLLKRIICLSTK
jgi:hypothetical protein